MINVCHVISDTNFGGAGRVLLHYCRYYDQSQFRLSVIVPKGSMLIPAIKETSVTVLEMDGLYDRAFSVNDVSRLIKLFRRQSFALIHSHGALSARIAAKICHIPVVYTRHSVFDLPPSHTSFPRKQLQGWLNNHFADGIIAVSPAAKELLAVSGTKPDHIRVIFNGVPPIEKGSAPFRSRYGFSGQDLVLGIVARLDPVKGHLVLLEAMTKLPDAIKLLIAGTGSEERSLREYAKQHALSGRVVFCGFVDDVGGLMNSLDLQINASFGTEATSMALLEGFSLGIPAIVSDFGGNPYVVENGVSGLIVPRQNPEALAQAILTLWKDPKLLHRLKEGAGRAYQEYFRVEIMTRQTEKYYREVLKKHA